ncbi:hypothetical protein F5Y05DRAFT_381668 [Hypoxylon sp. FL0543]|nr:hypothetical protein F5Y05DRAFT_381668 [Hypoxylon sp. FL0543]
MSQVSEIPSPAAGLRRSSIASEKTLVDRKPNASEQEYQEYDYDRKSLDAYSTQSRAGGSSLLDRAAKKVKSKLGGKDSASKTKSQSKTKPKRTVGNSYPDTAYMWRSLAETRL